MLHRFSLLLLLLFVVLAGCGVRPVTGGTKGTLRAGGQSLGDVQVTVHEMDGGSARPIGFAVTAADGSFQLVQNGARGALLLPPGEYRCTLESAGAPVRIPPEFSRAETTPLKVSWSADGSMNLEVPIPFAP